MRWRKLGRVFAASGQRLWMQTHAYLPTVDEVAGHAFRVYAAFLDGQKIGRIGYVDVDVDNPVRVLGVSPQPVLDIGEPGFFDDNGVSPLSIVNVRGKKYLYYVGWQLGVKVRYYLFTGLAVSNDGGKSFKRVSRAPVMDRSSSEPFLRSGTFVRREGPRWKAWYACADRWMRLKGKGVPTYCLKYAESADGVRWPASGRVAISLSRGEYGLGRPFVFREGGLYRMFYSVRTLKRRYRIGYAESRDGLRWIRKDRLAGIEASKGTAWDSQMVCFPSLADRNGRRFMFYNGNNYGETGFGVAELVRP